MPQGAFLSTINAVALYPNIPHSKGLTSLQRFLQLIDNNRISSTTLIEFVEIVLEHNIFEFDGKIYFKLLRGTTIGAKFAPPFGILFIAD